MTPAPVYALFSVLHWLACFIVLAEALNKLHRSNATEPGIGRLLRLNEALKAFGWFFLALGAGGGLITPFLHLEPPSFMDMSTSLGFSVLIVRTRLQEIRS